MKPSAHHLADEIVRKLPAMQQDSPVNNYTTLLSLIQSWEASNCPHCDPEILEVVQGRDADMVPIRLIEMAREIDDWMKQHGHNDWKLGPIQKRQL